jgi:hypothetical protein
MSYLEELSLYPRIENRNRFIDGTHLQNEIFVYMPQLHSFIFYISTYTTDTVDLLRNLSTEDIQRTFTNIGRENVVSIVNNIGGEQVKCSIFSLPFSFDRLEEIGNIFPNIIFSYVTYLVVQDVVPFNHEFFIRVARAFPLLKNFHIFNNESQSLCNLNNRQSYEIAEYPHLTSLDMIGANCDYLEQFLNQRKTYAPSLTELIIVYNDLGIVTKNFKRQVTQRNYANVKRIYMIIPLVHTKYFYLYFPLL